MTTRAKTATETAAIVAGMTRIFDAYTGMMNSYIHESRLVLAGQGFDDDEIEHVISEALRTHAIATIRKAMK